MVSKNLNLLFNVSFKDGRGTEESICQHASDKPKIYEPHRPICVTSAKIYVGFFCALNFSSRL